MPLTHEMIDRRSLPLHEAVAGKIRESPALLEVARENLQRWSRMDGGLPPPLKEWQDILDGRSLEDILQLICDQSENAARLRQSSPFGGILTEAERLLILKKHEPHAA